MLQRVLEPEVMDTPEEARAYNAMDHREVNRRFVDDFLAAGSVLGEILDLGTGTALIPIELCQRDPQARVLAIDLSVAMLDLARGNVEIASLMHQIMLDRVDGKGLPYANGRFAAVMSNSIVHHIPEPLGALAEAWRVLAPGGLLFIRDLLRPADDSTVSRLVELYAAGATPHQRQLFDDSLRAALSLDEIRELVAALGVSADTVQPTSDRHWTWCVRKDVPYEHGHGLTLAGHQHRLLLTGLKKVLELSGDLGDRSSLHSVTSSPPISRRSRSLIPTATIRTAIFASSCELWAVLHQEWSDGKEEGARSQEGSHARTCACGPGRQPFGSRYSYKSPAGFDTMSDATVLTYARLYRFLQDLGFQDESVQDSHRVFRHRRSNTVLVQAIHSPDEPVNLVDFKSTRRMLDEKGLLAAAEFDQLAAAAPRPSAAS